MLKSIKVRDYMTSNLITVKPETELFAAIEVFLKHRISGTPVVDEQGHLLGMLSEGDCLRGILSGAYYEEVGGNVAAYMTRELEVISPEADIIEAAELFTRNRRRRLPVVEHGQLVGQISRCDVLRAVKEFAQHDNQGKFMRPEEYTELH
ncbi:CBS domain-containing protein [Atopomonas sediminilitoris]|uniref:CBS domain-containing protein n=1 Tax=Atopomonas sediminilitoris TaxID=2919919 RepID=UPI001F4D5BC8|nr:CBS domain-containing protein [Atopomonas sediminilitoris]MCJ8168673.1 CBS domain-containing protein [Atopomonas sediminilitoris]